MPDKWSILPAFWLFTLILKGTLSVVPIKLALSTAPALPINAHALAAPSAPLLPVGPVAPVAPVDPVAPAIPPVPLLPVGPVAPIVQLALNNA